MYFDFAKLGGRDSYKLVTATIVPRPIAWIVSRDREGRVNAAPFSFFNAFSGAPPVICVGIGSRDSGQKDTLQNIRLHGQFVVNLVPAALAEAMNVTAIEFPPAIDELAQAGLATLPCEKVSVPRIADSPVALECELKDLLQIERTNHLVVARVLAIHVRDDAVIDAQKCYIDTAKLDLLGRMESPGGYTRTRDRFTMPQIPLADWRGRPDGGGGPDGREG